MADNTVYCEVAFRIDKESLIDYCKKTNTNFNKENLSEVLTDENIRYILDTCTIESSEVLYSGDLT